MIAFAAALSVFAPTVFFGYGEERIAIEPPYPLGGYTERRDRLASGVGSPLWVRAVTFESAGRRISMVSAELLTIPSSLTEAVRERLGSNWEVLIAATHTHSAPDSQMFNRRMTFKIPGIATYNADRFWEVVDCVVRAIRRSEPVHPLERIEIVRGRAGRNHPRVEGGVPLREVTAVRLLGGDFSCELLHFAAHATLLDEHWNLPNGDWPGAWAGQGKRRMVFQGAMGDLSPSARSPEEMAGALDFALATGEVRAEPQPTLAFVRVLFDPGERVVHPLFPARYGLPEPIARNLVKQFAQDRGEVVAVGLGSVVWVGVSCELASVPGLRIEAAARQLGFRYPLVVSFANDWLGYVVTPEQYAAGVYEATLSFYGPGMADRVVEAATQAVAALPVDAEGEAVQRTFHVGFGL